MKPFLIKLVILSPIGCIISYGIYALFNFSNIGDLFVHLLALAYAVWALVSLFDVLLKECQSEWESKNNHQNN